MKKKNLSFMPLQHKIFETIRNFPWLHFTIHNSVKGMYYKKKKKGYGLNLGVGGLLKLYSLTCLTMILLKQEREGFILRYIISQFFQIFLKIDILNRGKYFKLKYAELNKSQSVKWYFRYNHAKYMKFKYIPWDTFFSKLLEILYNFNNMQRI